MIISHLSQTDSFTIGRELLGPRYLSFFKSVTWDLSGSLNTAIYNVTKVNAAKFVP